MFCPYPSFFDQLAQGQCVRYSKGIPAQSPGLRGTSYPGATRSTDHNPERVAARRDAPDNDGRNPVGVEVAPKAQRGLACFQTGRFKRAAWAFAVFSATLISSAFAGDLPRSSDYDYDPPTPGTYTLPVVKPAADGEVLDAEGHPLFLREFTRGRITVLSFIYTRCAAAKACPYATGVLNQLHRLSQEDSALAQEMRLVSMSFDPVNDTPERMAAYSGWARGRTNAAEWRFLTTRSAAELQPILAAYGQAVDRKKNPLDPTGPLNHTLRVFLIDRAGNIRNIYSSGTLDPRLILADVRTLMMEAPHKKAASLSSN